MSFQHRDYVKAAKDLVLKSGCTKIKTVAVKGDVLKESIISMVKSLNGFDWSTLEELTLDVFADLGCEIGESAESSDTKDDTKEQKDEPKSDEPKSRGKKKETQQGPALIVAAQDLIDFLGFPKTAIVDFKKLGTAEMVKQIQEMATDINLPYKENGKEVVPNDKPSDFKPETIQVFEDNKITVNWNEEEKEKGKGKTDKKEKAKDKPATTTTTTNKKEKKGPGVIKTIQELVSKGTEKKPITKDDLLKALVKAFPDRNEDSMAKTIQAQLPKRMSNEKGMNIIKNEKGAFYCE